MADDTNFQKRLPAVDRRISGIKPEDIRIRVTGTVVDKQEDRIAVDDGTGKINIVFDMPFKAEMDQMIRVFGRVIPVEGGFELQGEIIQDMTELDIELYRKVREATGRG